MKSQPYSRSRSAVVSSSTPSATTCKPRLWPRSMVERTIAAPSRFVVMSCTNDLSILISRTGTPQVRQGRVPGTEIVDRDLHAGGVQPLQRFLGLGRDDGSFGDLQAQLFGRYLPGSQQFRHSIG